MMPALIAVILALLSTPEGNRGGRLAILILEAPPVVDTRSIVADLEEAVLAEGRFVPVAIPDSLRELRPGIDYSTAIAGLCAAYSLDAVLALSIPEPDVESVTVTFGDSLSSTGRTKVSATGRFYSSIGSLTGTVSESVVHESRFSGAEPDIDAMASGAALSMLEEAMLELFPAETRFIAGSGSRISLPAGSGAGFSEGMFVSLVAVAPSIPRDVSQYDLLRSRGVAQVMSCTEDGATALLLSGALAPGGEVVALERGNPASVAVGWESAPMSLVQGAESPEPFDDARSMNRVRITVSSLRWGFCYGGSLFAGVMENLSSFGVDLQAGWRLPVSAPRLAARLDAGATVDFMIQDVAEDSLASDATSAIFGGYASCGLDFLASDRLGLTLSALAFAGTEADSWTVQDRYGRNREAFPSEVYYSGVKRDPLSLRAGFFYLIL
ncbi:MAG TPA: hypothetical protein PKV37_07125 [Candidatus Fermentibacter daniensis]|nr:hypothetical protein [Candidatus Fermentibacter daniensis]